MAKPETNVEFVTNLMEFSQTGSLMQMFVISALDVYSRQIMNATEEQFGANGFISFEAFQRCAKEVNEALDNRGK